MNPMTNMKNVKKLSEQELAGGSKTSWHNQYKDSAWIFVGGLPYDLTEGDIICIFSQYGEIVNINLIRAKDTGKSKGFCFICYEDQRSTILAVDNFNGIKILKRTIRVDHVAEYKVPKEGKNTDEETKKLYTEGCAPRVEPVEPRIKPEPSFKYDQRVAKPTVADQVGGEIKLPARLPIYNDIKKEVKEEPVSDDEKLKKKKKKSKKKSRKKEKKSESSESESSSDEKRNSDNKRRDRSPIATKQKERYTYEKSDKEKDRNSRHWSPKRRERSRSKSKERDGKKKFKRELSPYVPKRYR